MSRALDLLLRAIRGRLSHGFVVWTPPEADARALAAGLANALAAHPPPVGVSLIELAGAPLRRNQARSLLEPILNGRDLVIVSAGGTDLPAVLADRWERWLEHPTGGSVSVMRGLTLDSSLDLRDPGVVVAVLPAGPGWRRVDRAHELHLQPETAQELHERVRGEPDAVVGSSPPEIDIRDLCLLHARDPDGTPERPLQAVLEGADAVTWTDLEVVLAAGRSYQWVLDGWDEAGRLDETKYAFGHAAFDFLDKRALGSHQGPTTAVYDSIWDVLWDYRWLDADARYIFRGQVDARWSLSSSLFRPDQGSPPDVGTFASRVDATETFLDELRDRAPDLVGTDATEEELLAVAQHYGFATPLLDFTRSLPVAAFFATHREPGERDNAIGVIYYMRETREELTGGSELSEHASLGAFSLLSAARLHLGEVSIVEPHLADEDNRIARQQGLFISGYQVQDLQQVAIDRLFFRQRPSEVFEDESRGVTAGRLLPPDAPIQRLADEVKQRVGRNRRQLNEGLASARLPAVSLIGSYGAHLFAQVREAGNFLDSVREAADGVSIDAIAAVFEDYFAAAYARAQVEEVLDNRSEEPATPPLVVAADRLAELAQTDRMRLWATVFPVLLPGPAEDLIGRPTAEPIDPKTTAEQLAVATVFFLAAWEHLQFVRGAAARSLVQKAHSVLLGHGIPQEPQSTD